MQCRPIRHRIASSEGPAGDLRLELLVHETDLTIARDTDPGGVPNPRQRRDASGARLRRRDRSAPRGPTLPRTQPVDRALPPARRRSSRQRGLTTRSRRKPGQARPRRDHQTDREHGTRRATRYRRDRPVPRRRLRLPTPRHPLPRLPPSRSKAGSSNTPAGSCAPKKAREQSASTTTPTPACRCCAPCTRDVSRPTGRSDSHVSNHSASPPLPSSGFLQLLVRDRHG